MQGPHTGLPTVSLVIVIMVLVLTSRAALVVQGLVDMFCRILIAVDEDLVSLDIPRWGHKCIP